jgi:TonB family protein
LFVACRICNAQTSFEKFFYDKEGNKTDSANAFKYSVFLYDDSAKKAGTVIRYSSKGNMTSEIHYSNIAEEKLEGIYKCYYETGELKSSCNYSALGREGYLITYYPDGKIRRKDHFTEGKFINGNCYTSDGKDTTHFEYEIMPWFPGGENELIKFLSTNVVYPLKARRKNIYGKVIIEFTVNKSGDVEDVQIKKSVHRLLDEEALRVVHKMPKWLPGFQDGEPVSVLYVLPISFKLK